MRKDKPLILPLILVFVIAFFLRFWQLGVNPPSLAWDEAAWGYNAYSLSLTASDEHGRFLPLDYFESFGDFKPPVYAYLTVLPIKIFGLSEFATRFPSALLGVLTVLAVYFLVKEIFHDSELKKSKVCHLALLASFLLAVSPWHIMLSRAAFEANVASFFIVVGATAFLASRRRVWWLPLSALAFALAIQTFNTARIVAPLLVLILAASFYKLLWQNRRWTVISAVVGLIALLPAIPFFLTPQAQLRFKEVSIFSDIEIIKRANQEMANDNWVWWSRIIHNRRWAFTREYLRHFLDNFNPAFLFIKGDGNPKFSTQDVGEFYLIELPFLVLGACFLFRKRPGYWWLIPIWLLVGIAPAATTRETPHALRIEATLPTWQILTSFGLIEFWDYMKKQSRSVKNFLRVAICGLFLLNFVYFQHGYWRHYPIEFAHEWQYGYKEAIEYLEEVEDNYDQIWFSDKLGRPYIYFLYYLQYDPYRFRQEAVVVRDVFGFVEVRSFGKYYFYRLGEAPQGQNILVVDKAEAVPEKAHIVKTFYLPNGQENLKAYAF